MRIVCQQTILMKYALFVIFEKTAKFEIAVCCKIGGALRVKKGWHGMKKLYYRQS